MLSSLEPKPDSIFIENIGNIEIRTSKRAKQLRLAVSGRSGAYVVRPKGVSNRTIQRFVTSNTDWLLKRFEKMPNKLTLKPGERFSRTKTLLVRNSKSDLDISIVESDDELLLTMTPESKLEDEAIQGELMKHVIKIWRKEAKIYLPKRLDMLARKHSLSFNEARVKYMHSRWGSCSSRNNINLNIQLMRLAPELIDHVLIHELVHTREHNHSKAFWSLFESLEPNARKTSKLLKSHQLF